MNLPKRAQSIIAGAVLGLVGVATFATPALACHPLVSPISACKNKDDSWVVRWQVTNSEKDLDGDVTAVTVTPDDTISMTGIVVGARIPANGTLGGEQKLPATAESASISVTAHWIINYRDTTTTRRSEVISKPTKDCVPTTHPSPSNSTSPSPSSSPSKSPSPSKSTSRPPSEPQFVYDATCDSLTVGVEVPAAWPKDLTVTFTPSTGKGRTVVGKRGKTTEVEFPASKGLKVTATAKGHEDETTTITYKTPADCDTSDVPSLPVTGGAAGTIMGGAAGLLAVGGVLFLLARRRKVKFTA